MNNLVDWVIWVANLVVRVVNWFICAVIWVICVVNWVVRLVNWTVLQAGDSEVTGHRDWYSQSVDVTVSVPRG